MASAVITRASEPPIPANQILAQLQALLDSKCFAGAGQLSAFLRFVVEQTVHGRREVIKESLIGVEVFGRPAGYDPSADPVVRVRAGRLRAKLREYYDGEGARDAVTIEIPKGSYVPVFALRPVAVRPARKSRVIWLLLALPLAAGAILYSASIWTRPVSGPSIAVLPFVNLTGVPADDPMVDGLSEELTTCLAQAPNVRVVARTSAFQFRGSRDVRNIGRQLRTRFVMEGSVRREAGRLIVTAQLIETGNGFHLFAEKFEKSSDQAFAIPGMVARRTLAALEPQTRATSQATASGTRSAAAHDLFLKGRYLERQRGVRNSRQAIECFRQATETDPGYAQAWGALARAHAIYTFHRSETSSEDARQARQAAARALEIEERMAEAHTALAMVSYWHDWKWVDAEPHYRRALEISPSYGFARQDFALALMSRGRFDESIEESRKALELDPLSYAVSNDLAVALYAARRFDESLARADQVLGIKPTFFFAHLLKGSVHQAQRKYPEAIEEYRKVEEAAGAVEPIRCRLGGAYALAGRGKELAEILAALEKTPEGDRAWVYRAMLYVGKGDFDRVFQCLGKAVGQHETDVLFLDADPTWDPIRADPRFEAIRKRVGLGG